MQICVEADNLAINTLRSFYADNEDVRASTVRRIVEAINRLEKRSKSRAVG